MTVTEPKTQDDLKKLLQSFKQATEFWIQSITINQFNQINGNNTTTTTTIENPQQELIKLIKLIKAHTTKVGIIFKPSNLFKDPNVAYNTLEKLSETLVLIISIIIQLENEQQNLTTKKISKIFYDEIIDQIKSLFSSIIELNQELINIINNGDNEKDKDDDNDNDNDNDNDDDDSGRLISVGKIWSNCDSLDKLLNEGDLGLLTTKIKQSISILEDGFEEFVTWANNPKEIEDDPFGLSDDDDDEEEEEDDEEEEEDNSLQSTIDVKELSEYSLIWVKKIELIKLLISSFKKSSLPKSNVIPISGKTIDEINNLQLNLVQLIDNFIVDLMLDRNIHDDEIIRYNKGIINQAIKLSELAITIYKSINNNEKKLKWYETFINKISL
ncbi:conserved hypothetical protein [Candida dubliniensis CD36]|uniref:Cyclin-D1-binding protein 1-like N-terminal domain-containing protein n=1 Tax=Candida dubliniensis (strain CD36 / ATCC MYA-646 / CBS 7987 / NCPF 3949 / NRRL Y-17841) TaxID=573826 RepID=B9WMX3_CANDC|nr:conserved hypothetical protein [Candida dubliniensis CD36]CAX40439.1 conserved hypothetical protein [Candida dubliniensis CD36]